MKYNEPQLRLPVRPIISICCSFKKVPCCLVFIVNDSPLSRFCAFYKSHFFPTVWKVLKEDVNWAWLQFGRFSVSTVIFNLFFWFKSRTMCPSVNLDPLLNLFGILRPIRNIISCIKNGCNPVIFNTNMKKIVMCFHAQIDSMWLLGGVGFTSIGLVLLPKLGFPELLRNLSFQPGCVPAHTRTLHCGTESAAHASDLLKRLGHLESLRRLVWRINMWHWPRDHTGGELSLWWPVRSLEDFLDTDLRQTCLCSVRAHTHTTSSSVSVRALSF